MPQSLITCLWTIPRSVSTAFEKMVDNRGDMIVFGEPFIDCYKKFITINNNLSIDYALKSSNYLQVLEKIDFVASNGTKIFIKEMAYHVKPLITEKFLKQYNNTFLIRHPKYTLPSLYKMRNNFTWEETGFEQLYRLFCIAQNVSNEPLIVIDSHDILKSPEIVITKYFEKLNLPVNLKALTWNYGSRPEWSNRQKWHQLAIESTGFLPPKEPDYDVLKVPEISKVYERCVNYYEKLVDFKIKI